MRTIDLMYKELKWNRRILDAGGASEDKRKKKKCHHFSVAVISYFLGIASIILLSIITTNL